jgi:hypothetical protein
MQPQRETNIVPEIEMQIFLLVLNKLVVVVVNLRKQTDFMRLTVSRTNSVSTIHAFVAYHHMNPIWRAAKFW